MPGRAAFVPLRYGPQIVGGSEALTREIAMGLAGRGWEVEILTTRVVDHQSMADELPEGESHEDGLTVRRFSTSHHWSKPGFRAQQQIQDDVLPAADVQWTWVSWRFTMPDLFHHLLRYSGTYDAVVFSPYMFWNTTVGIGAVAGNAVVMPCLHDESYARLSVMRPVLADPASVWFLSEPEHELAHRLGPVADRHTVTGAGIHVPAGYDPDGFRRRHSIDGPFILYAGRREKDKGWGWLLETFSAAVRAGMAGVDLVTFGSGTVEAPEDVAGRVKDLGFVSATDRNDAFAAALAYVQPSRMESFSRTVMEAWLAGTPVLAIDGSAVVDWHCRRSGGGLIFSSGEDLARHVGMLQADPDRAAEMAARGRDYVLREYDWPVVLDRIEEDLSGFVGRTGARAEAAPTIVGGAGAGEVAGVPAAGPMGSGAVAAGAVAGAGGAAPVLVVGSYPPVPVAGAEATLAEVRRAWAAGDEVTVVSPRLSAAHLAVPISGPLAGRRLDNVRRHTGARRLVMVLERGFPLPEQPALQIVTAAALAPVLRRFDHVRLVRAGAEVHPRAWALLTAAGELAEAPAGPTAPGVTPLGPTEVPMSERTRRLAAGVARRALGPRAPAVRARLGAVRRRLGM